MLQEQILIEIRDALKKLTDEFHRMADILSRSKQCHCGNPARFWCQVNVLSSSIGYCGEGMCVLHQHVVTFANNTIRVCNYHASKMASTQ